MPSALVVGAGVVGLTTGIRLLEKKWNVTIVTDATTPYTTSDGAAAIWLPFLSNPIEKVSEWGRATHRVFMEQSALPSATDMGIEIRSGFDFYNHKLESDPLWSSFVKDFRHCTPSELPQGQGYVDGIHFTVPIVAMPKYMRFLMIRFQELGGKIVTEKVTSLSELANTGRADVIVNCTGIASRQLVHDDSVFPLRGQILRVYAPEVKNFYFDECDPDKMIYIIPRSDLCILGGTAQKDNYDTSVSKTDAEEIIKRCAKIVPSLAKAPIVNHFVGLRPGRTSVRVEVDRDVLTNGNGRVIGPINVPVIHNYGHGGSGMTISWGCADDVAKLASSCVKSRL